LVGEPFHVPIVAVSTLPSAGVPEMVGAVESRTSNTARAVNVFPAGPVWLVKLDTVAALPATIAIKATAATSATHGRRISWPTRRLRRAAGE
jgi:hypothetical protein